MELAPNAGYSLVIQKSYAVFTLFAAVILFNGEISVRKILISIFIVVFAAAVVIDRKQKVTRASYEWAILAIIAMVFFGITSLSSRYFAELGVLPAPQLFWTCLLTLLITGAESARAKVKLASINVEVLILLAPLGISVSAFYYFKLIAEIAAPNLGYVGAINAASNAFYTVLVAILFKDHLSAGKLLAVVGVTVGIVMLLLA
jgi:drug/metabolite transporter (DMT)-like permease